LRLSDYNDCAFSSIAKSLNRAITQFMVACSCHNTGRTIHATSD
jgi:hypothetical protein